MARESTAGVLQPLIPKMSFSHAHTPAPRTYAGCEKSSPTPSLYNGITNGRYNESSTARPVRHNVAKVTFLVFAIVLSAAWWFSGHRISAPGDLDATLTPSPTSPRQHFARAPASSLLEVFQIHPPLLTVGSDGTLEITDDSAKPGNARNHSGHTVCEEVLAVHSFAYSYGQPFISNYTAPECPFNRVTWNLTVVSAGRQFDRLGIVYLGDIEVFRTSTAEPTAGGITWTYLKVSHSKQSELRASDCFIGHDKLSVSIQERSETHLRLGQSHRRCLHRSFQRNPYVDIFYRRKPR